MARMGSLLEFKNPTHLNGEMSEFNLSRTYHYYGGYSGDEYLIILHYTRSFSIKGQALSFI